MSSDTSSSTSSNDVDISPDDVVLLLTFIRDHTEALPAGTSQTQVAADAARYMFNTYGITLTSQQVARQITIARER
jgi:hypothetical protein